MQNSHHSKHFQSSSYFKHEEDKHLLVTHCRNPPNTCLLLDPLRNGSPLGRSNVPVPQISHTLQQRTLIKQPHDGRRRERQWRVFRWRGARLLVANRSNGVVSGGGGGLFLIPYQDWGCISEYEAAESSHWVDRHSILQGEIIKTWIAIKSMRGQSISCRIGILKELAFSRSKYYASPHWFQTTKNKIPGQPVAWITWMALACLRRHWRGDLLASLTPTGLSTTYWTRKR